MTLTVETHANLAEAARALTGGQARYLGGGTILIGVRDGGRLVEAGRAHRA